MRKITFAIIGWCSKNTQDLVDAVRRKGHRVSVISIKDVIFFLASDAFRAYCEAKKQKDSDFGSEPYTKTVNLLEDFDIVMFRSYGRYTIEVQMLIDALVGRGKVVLDESIGKQRGKIFQAYQLIKAGLPYLPTVQGLRLRSYRKILAHTAFPIIVKPLHGKQGRDIKKVSSTQEALAFFKENPYGFLLQQYIPIKEDFRVLVVGKKIIGAMKRFTIHGDVRSNVSLGARTQRVTISPLLKALAQRATRALGYDVAGVDIAQYHNRAFILEVNQAPQWQAFKKTTGINPAGAIIDYAIVKFSKRNISEQTD